MAVERKARPGGHFRSLFRFRKNREAEYRAQQEILMFQTGEPSVAFFPVTNLMQGEVTVFVAPKSSVEVSPLRFQLEKIFGIRS